MKKGQLLWTRDELILTLNLYYKTPFGRLHNRNPDVIMLSKLINRTPSSVAYKLVNLASLDPSLKSRGIKGASNASKLDKEIWDEFYNNLGDISFESEALRAKFENKSLEEFLDEKDVKIKEGIEIKATIKQRVNQSFFRNMILASYNDTCCITGIKIRELLIAGHIKPWSEDKENRLNPRNGIAINSLHDKAFESGYLTITPNYKVKISPMLLKQKSDSVNDLFNRYHNKEIILPTKFLPNPSFLNYHNKERFKY